MTPPRIVLEPGADLAAAVRDLGRGGWRVHRGFALPDEPWDLAPARIVVTGDVSGEEAAQAALLAAARGTGLAVRLDFGKPWAAAFLADLARMDFPQAAPHPPGTALRSPDGAGRPASTRPAAAAGRGGAGSPRGTGSPGGAGAHGGAASRGAAGSAADAGSPDGAGSASAAAPLRPAGPGAAAMPAGLTPEQCQLLDLLASGASIAQAASKLYLSLRTANRRVATARDALGVTSTREAVLAYVRMRDG